MLTLKIVWTSWTKTIKVSVYRDLDILYVGGCFLYQGSWKHTGIIKKKSAWIKWKWYFQHLCFIMSNTLCVSRDIIARSLNVFIYKFAADVYYPFIFLLFSSFIQEKNCLCRLPAPYPSFAVQQPLFSVLHYCVICCFILCVLKNPAVVLDFSSQMYVPGALNDVENVLVDVGTGYYVEKATIFFIWEPINNYLSYWNCGMIFIKSLYLFSVECGRLKGILQTQNRIPHKADRKNSASPSRKTRNETR